VTVAAAIPAAIPVTAKTVAAKTVAAKTVTAKPVTAAHPECGRRRRGRNGERERKRCDGRRNGFTDTHSKSPLDS
jgi:hypothetical protein